MSNSLLISVPVHFVILARRVASLSPLSGYDAPVPQLSVSGSIAIIRHKLLKTPLDENYMIMHKKFETKQPIRKYTNPQALCVSRDDFVSLANDIR
jgi:hypothetical protein